MAHCQQLDWDDAKEDGKPWYHASRGIWRKEPTHWGQPKMAGGLDFFISDAILYKRSANWTLLYCVDEQEAKGTMEEVYEGTFGTHTNGHALAHKILRAESRIVVGTSYGVQWTQVHSMAIDYFTKWVEVTSYASVTKGVVVNFIKRDIIC
ncbi:hypothetical protein CR513_33936, partial [Mucuna pruriens]